MNELEIDVISIELPALDLVDFLSQQTLFPKVFWKDRDTEVTHAALGSLLNLDTVPDPNSTLRFYGGMQFDPSSEKDTQWEAFPRCKFWLPQFEIVQTKEKTTLLIQSHGKADKDAMQLLTFTPKEMPETFSSYIKGDEVPNFEKWNHNIKSALEKIHTHQLKKVVLARKMSLKNTNSSGICPWTVFKKLQQKAVRATLFAFQMTPDEAFIGATPEKLYSRRGRHVEIDAVAGTRKRGQTEAEDAEIALELLKSAKDLREFFIVKEYLSSVLLPLAEQMSWQNEDSILKNAHVQHLYNRLKIDLKEGVNDHMLIQLLHPTPALGGFPKEKSLECIRKLEGFDRGWYGAPVGFISKDHSSLAVAIRSALIRCNGLELFSGAGIVEASNAANEWEELNQKLKPFLSLFLKETQHG